MSTIRSLHLRGALGAVRTEMWDGREHLVVPVVALQEAVIHAVNAKTAEYVSGRTLTNSVGKWNGHPLVVGHPVKDGRQISAHDPAVLERHGFGFIRSSKMNGNRLGMEAMVDVSRLTALKHDQLLADLRAGKSIEVSIGAFVNTNDAKGTHGGKSYDGEWTEITPDHLAFLPNDVGACSMAMGCGAHRAAMLVTAEGFEALSNPDGINQYSHGGAASAHEKAAKAHDVASRLQMKAHAPVMGHGKNWPDDREKIRSDRAHAASEKAMDATEKAHGYSGGLNGKSSNTLDDLYEKAGDALNASSKGSADAAARWHRSAADWHRDVAKEHRSKLRGAEMSSLEKLKARVLALFDTPEQAASEEAAELIAYQSMRDLFDSAGDQWDAASGLIDDLIADEDETPTETPAQEEAESEVEDARLDAIRMHCYTMIAALQSVCNACSEQQMPEPLAPSDPRYMEALRTLSNPEGINQYSNSSTEHGSASEASQKEQEHHDFLKKEGFTAGRTETYKGRGGKSVGSRTEFTKGSSRSVVERFGPFNGKNGPKGQHGVTLLHGVTTRQLAALRALIGREISAKNLKTIQSAHDASHDMHTHTVGLGAECSGMRLLAGKQCEACDGTGQVKIDDKQQDCTSCDGTGVLKTAEIKAACRCEEADVNKAERIAALLKNEHNTVKDITDKTSDEVLSVLEAQADTNKKHAAELKAAQDRQAATEVELKAAQAAQIPAEELTSLRTLAEEKKQQDAAQKAGIIAQLKTAQTAYTEAELNEKPIAELLKIAQLAKVEKVDYSGRGLAISGAKGEDYTPPDPYAKGIKALQTVN